MNPLSYIIWHYSRAIWDLIKIWKNFLRFFWSYFFPITTLLKTLLSPWKRTGDDTVTLGFDPKMLLQRIAYSFASRLAGFFARSAIIILIFAVETILLILGPAILMLWLIWPVSLIISAISHNILGIIISALFLPVSLLAYQLSREKPADEMSLSEALNQKWSKLIWERIGIEKKEVPNDVSKRPEENLTAYLEKMKIKQDEFQTALIWEISKQKNNYTQKRFWRREILFSKGGFGRDWIYGFTPLLDQYAEPITALANYEQLIGRRNELEQLEMVLSRGRQSNVLVVGEPGVGKMSLLQKFARMVNSGHIGRNLAYRRVILFNLKGAMAGLRTAGELEERLMKVFNQARGAGDVILVMDDFHNLVSSSYDIGLGKKDISQILMPYLEGGYFQLIAITTYQGLHEQVEKHPDLLKFFEKVEVKEPDKETTVEICIDSVREIEIRVPVKFTVQAIKTIVDKSDLYVTDTPFPEKALDLLENTAIYVAKKAQDYLVKPEHVDAVISQKTEIPVGALSESEKGKLVNLEDIMHQRIINQEQAITEIASAMRRARLQIGEKKRPIGSFLFLGPTGVGKTETAKALAEIYFGSEDRMNRLDMSEYQGSSSVEKAIGSAGKGTPGFLTTLVRENPFSLLLLDEIEKADYGVLNLFLQILDEGWLTDAFGRKINFRNQIIIATSNAGAEFIRTKVLENTQNENLNKQLANYVLEKGIFKPEFLNRFDGVVMFTPITRENLLKISKLMLDGLKKRLAKQDLVFSFDEPLIKKIAELGYDPSNGARPMRRVIQKTVEDLIAKKLLKGEIQKDSPFTITAEEI